MATTITFLDLPEQQEAHAEVLAQVKAFASYENLVIVGIGGSSVGTEALWNILIPPNQQKKKLVFLDNTDFLAIERKTAGLNLEKTAWYIVSKSGSTLETLAATEWAAELYRKKNISFYTKCIVCTEKKKNTLSRWAEKHTIPQLEIPLGVGGRFSVLSPVGLFPLAFAGVDTRELLAGAKSAFAEQESIAELAGKCADSFPERNITVFWFYSSVIKAFGPWIQQLWAESLAKKVNLKGKKAPRASTPFFAVGASDQHSILQQVMEGTKDKFVIFFRCEELEKAKDPCVISEFEELSYLKNKTWGSLIQAAAEGTEAALKKELVPTHRIFFKDHSAHSLGHLVMWFELLVAEVAQLLQIDAFNQPGVELSKNITKEILQK
jgi:glucose-6-phosphate isomerase